MQTFLGLVCTGFLDTGVSLDTDCVGLFGHMSCFLASTAAYNKSGQLGGAIWTDIFGTKSQHSKQYMWITTGARQGWTLVGSEG